MPEARLLKENWKEVEGEFATSDEAKKWRVFSRPIKAGQVDIQSKVHFDSPEFIFMFK